MSQPRGNPDGEPRLFHTLKADVGRVTADVMRRGVRREIGGTLTALEAFYLSADARRRLGAMPPVRRFFHRLGWLVRSLLMKLTPARRVMLALGLLLLALGILSVEFETLRVSFRFPAVGVLILFILLMLELKDKLVARHELEAGRAVQLALMPERSPKVPGWDLWLFTQPANDVGGDLIDHLQIDERRHGVALGDVAGKALPAALLMVKLQATLRALIPQFESLSDLGAAVNHIIARDGLSNRFATLIYLALTADAGAVRVLNAGHMPPLIVRNGTIEWMGHGSVALGIMPDAAFSEERLELAEGDVLVVYSDGVTEAMNVRDEFFGEERLCAAVRETVGQSVEAIGARVLARLEAFVGDAPPYDDVSLVLLRRRRAA